MRRNGTLTLDANYDLSGNLSSRSDVGSYTYHATKKHAVTAAGSNSFAYDANGNVITRIGATLGWASYDLPTSLASGGNTASFAYAADRSRWRQIAVTAGVTETTIYVAGILEKVTKPSITLWKHYVAAPTGMGAVYVRRSDGTSDTYYLTTDHLGCTDRILKAATGTVQVAESFDAFGKRRGSDWQGGPSAADLTAIGNSTPDGFTGHEMLDGVGLIHMNGRVYDPSVGRFLSVDPVVRDIDASQSWNGYGYVEGRTLSATDPTGLFLSWLFSKGNVRPEGDPPPLPSGNFSYRTTHEFWVTEFVFNRTIGDFATMWGGRENSLQVSRSASENAGESAQSLPQSQQPSQQCFKPAKPQDGGDIIADAIVGFGDAFLIPILVRNLFEISGEFDYDSPAYVGGMITGTLWGSATIALRGGAALGGTKLGHALNHNPTIRLGPGRMPAAGPGLPSGTGVPRISVGSRPGGPHGDLRSRVPHLPPVGALAEGGNGC